MPRRFITDMAQAQCSYGMIISDPARFFNQTPPPNFGKVQWGMLHDQDDTICALATPPGAGGLGVIRLSGPRAFAVADAVTHRPRNISCARRKGYTLHRATVADTQGAAIDGVLLAVFHAPRSYTGEDTVEISAHGGPIPLRQILRRLLESGARLAQPGEFTQRAFLHGKMDLAQAEAVADIIAARTDQAHALAQRQGAGRLSEAVHAVRDILLGVLARIEASIEFPEDVGELDWALCLQELSRADALAQTLLQTADGGILTREGLTVVLLGRPNVGKSSLLNALLRTSRAIVTPIPGTTRDTLEETLNLHGIPLRLTDTAGLRETNDPIEQIGVARSQEALARADFVLLVLDAQTGETEEDAALRRALAGRPHLTVWNKWDLVADHSAACPVLTADAIAVSAATGWNMGRLEDTLAQAIGYGASPVLAADNAVVTHARHRRALEAAREGIEAARATCAAQLPADFLSIDVQGALAALGQITGETTPDDIVQEIFSRFCIGK